jgi:hypothetical protein
MDGGFQELDCFDLLSLGNPHAARWPDATAVLWPDSTALVWPS